MAKKLAVLAASLALLIPLSASAALTRTQADSLVNVVKASPTTPTSVFTPLITSFSSITTAQAESLINVIKAAPTASSGPFVDMLLAFTGETVLNPAVSFSAYPSSGPAPLLVQFSTNQQYGTYYYDTNKFLASCLPGTGNCNMSVGPSGWTYRTPGTYHASYVDSRGYTMGTQTITVTGTRPSLSYSVMVKAGSDGDTWQEGANIDGLALVIKNSSSLTQQITFPTNCWYTYRIYNKTTGALVFNLASVQHCITAGSAPATTFTLAPGDTKAIDFTHYNSTYHIPPGQYYMTVDVQSTYPLINAAILNFNVASPSATIDSGSLTTTSNHPTIIGSAKNTSVVSFSLFTSQGVSFYDSGSLSVVNGSWSRYIPISLSPGTYTIKVYDGGNTGSGVTLTSGTLVVQPALSCTLTVAPYGSGYGVIWTSTNAVTAHLSPIPGMGSGWVNVSVTSTNPASWVSANNQVYTLTVWDSAGNQATCFDGKG